MRLIMPHQPGAPLRLYLLLEIFISLSHAAACLADAQLLRSQDLHTPAQRILQPCATLLMMMRKRRAEDIYASATPPRYDMAAELATAARRARRSTAARAPSVLRARFAHHFTT